MRLAGTTERMRKYLGIALLPQAGVAVGLMLVVKEDTALSAMSDFLLAVGLAVVTINEIAGPIMTRLALRRSGDLGKDRARLIDFLHEENIVTDFKAENKEEAIEKLTDLLIRTNHLSLDRDQLLKSVLDRERKASTCIGSGLAIPHATLEEGNTLSGVMAISSEGLDFDTPDGLPVHCMILLATPASLRDRHLEVLAALARSIGSDYNIQRQLFHTHSPAHAYEILHVEELSDFNYFLEDEPL
jgi:mannitol/fructose-specific phosphotransferase system IIA component (Ntr-type)